MEHTIQISFIYDGNSHHTSCSSSVVPQLTAAVKDIASEIVKNYILENDLKTSNKTYPSNIHITIDCDMEHGISMDTFASK